MGRDSHLPFIVVLLVVGVVIALNGQATSKPKADAQPVAVATPAKPKTDQIALLDFGATWCGPCQRMKPILKQLESEGVSVEAVDVDNDSARADQFKIGENIPVLIVTRNGKEVERRVGGCSIEELRRMVARAKLSDQSPSSADAPKQTPAAKSTPYTTDPSKAARGPDGWRLRLFYPANSARGEQLRGQISAMKAIATKYGFDYATTDSPMFSYWHEHNISIDGVTLILAHPDGRIIYRESANIPTDPIELRETLRNAARKSWETN